MPLLQRVVKPKTRRGKKFLLERAPKVIENTKSAMFIRGAKTSQTVQQCMKDLYLLKKPLATFLNRKNDYRPFEDTVSLEFISQKNDASLFIFGNHNKKRPDNLILGRMYNTQLLDMFELGISNFKALTDFKTEKVSVGTKPCLLFAGEPFIEPVGELCRLKSLLLDFFRGEEVSNIRLVGLEHVIACTAVDSTVHFRSYRVLLKKSGNKTPRVELEEMGPSMDLQLRRTKLAADDLFKTALKKPPQIKIKKKKNIGVDAFGTQLGRIHMPKLDISKVATRRIKGMPRKSAASKRRKNELSSMRGGRPAQKTKH